MGAHSTQEGRDRSPFVTFMAESQHQAATPPNRSENGPPSADPGPSPADGARLRSAIEASDETPTIISRGPQAALRAGEGLTEVLRGRKLAHFELIEPVGVGGMAAVIRARDTQLDRSVALKILPPELAADPENVRRFHQEARAAAKLDHENIARVFYCGEDQGLHFIAFEFVEGDTLRALLEQRGRLPVPEAVGYLLQVATGLAHAAARGVVHRDIKPSNIIISPNGRAKLVDMGLARSVEPHPDAGLTHSGVTLGTFDYISPEQALEPREADTRSDIYSLGCTFYHILTGQPPVPEGTAAKKLHHHQHVAPVDPRQLNPEIPDDVAAVLARMMAKDPRERYQRPEQLVQHLILLAQRLGVGAGPPANMLFVEAPLPDPPRTRPVLMAACAVLILVGLVLVLSPNPAPTPSKTSRDPADRGGVGADLKPHPANLPHASSPARPGTDSLREVRGPDGVPTYHAQDAAGLARFLHDNATVRELHVYLANDLALTRDAALRFDGHETVLEPEPKAERSRAPTITLLYRGELANAPWAALTLGNGTLTVRGVRFVVDSKQAPGVTLAAVWRQGGRLILEDCVFDQEGPPEAQQGQVSSVRVTGPPAEDGSSALVVKECYFARGQHALTLAEEGTALAVQSAFGPHTAALFEVRQAGLPAANREAGLTLRHCSALLAEGPVFRLGENIAWPLNVQDCIFSRPGGAPPRLGSAALLEQVGRPSDRFRYTGADNCYHNLGAFWLRLGAQGPVEAVTSLAKFRRHVGVEDETSTELAVSPWETPDPLRLLGREPPERIFRVNIRLPELYQVKDSKRLFAGVERCLGRDLYAAAEQHFSAEAALPVRVARAGEKIVDPGMTVSVPGENAYKSLSQALEDAKPGDVIRLRHNGLLRIEPLRLNKPGTDLTIRPDDGYHPILTIGPTTEPDAALFRIYDGRLRLEGLEFQLAPASSEFKAQTVAAIMGDGQCLLKDCLATLAGVRDAVPLTLVTLGDPSEIMRMGPQPSRQQDPRITLENCLVRGVGSLLNVRASRRFDLRLDNCLVALDGSLLIVDANSREPRRGANALVTLSRVTTYLTDYLVWLRALKEEGRNTKGLVPLQIQSASHCLFVSAGGKPLVHVEGMDSDEQMKRSFLWTESQHNAYSNYKEYLDEQPWPESEMMPTAPPYSRTQWQDFTQDANGRFERVRFVNPPPELLAQAVPADFQTANLQGYGADLNRLPRPVGQATAVSQ